VVWLEDLRRQSSQEWTSKRRAKGSSLCLLLLVATNATAAACWDCRQQSRSGIM
jgi:hypothetical protein